MGTSKLHENKIKAIKFLWRSGKWTQTEIATALSVSPKTVERYLSGIEKGSELLGGHDTEKLDSILKGEQVSYLTDGEIKAAELWARGRASYEKAENTRLTNLGYIHPDDHLEILKRVVSLFAHHIRSEYDVKNNPDNDSKYNAIIRSLTPELRALGLD